MSETCEVVMGEFVWGAVRCDKPAVATIWFDGEEWSVCREHEEAA